MPKDIRSGGGPSGAGTGKEEPLSPDRNVFSFIADLAGDVHRRVDRKDVSERTPTLPLYNSEYFPENAVDGQVVRDWEDPDVIWIYQESRETNENGFDDTWHKIGTIPWALGDIKNTGSINLGSSTTIVEPLDAYSSNDDMMYELSGDHKGIIIKRKGVYLIGYSAQFFASGVDPDTFMGSGISTPGSDNSDWKLGDNPSIGRLIGGSGVWSPNALGIYQFFNPPSTVKVGGNTGGETVDNAFFQVLIIRLSNLFGTVLSMPIP